MKKQLAYLTNKNLRLILVQSPLSHYITVVRKKFGPKTIFSNGEKINAASALVLLTQVDTGT